MSSAGQIALGLGVAVAITFTLRATPFLLKSVLKDSRVLAEVAAVMPLGAVVVLAVYAVSRISVGPSLPGSAEVAGLAVTVLVHLRRGNLVLSLVAGTAVCLALANA